MIKRKGERGRSSSRQIEMMNTLHRAMNRFKNSPDVSSYQRERERERMAGRGRFLRVLRRGGGGGEMTKQRARSEQEIEDDDDCENQKV